MSYNIPDYTLRQLHNYINDGVPPSGFLRAVLTNNLIESFNRADDNNMVAMFDIVRYVYNEVPSNLWGDANKIANHIFAKEQERENGIVSMHL